MSDDTTEFRSGVDRMDHPLSHTAALIGGVAFIGFAGCLALLLSDERMLRSTTWWSVVTLTGAMLCVCMVGYFRPCSRAIYIPLLLAGVVSLAFCAWNLFHAWHTNSPLRAASGLHHALMVFCAWLAWAVRTWRLLRHGRQSRRDAV